MKKRFLTPKSEEHWIIQSIGWKPHRNVQVLCSALKDLSSWLTEQNLQTFHSAVIYTCRNDTLKDTLRNFNDAILISVKERES